MFDLSPATGTLGAHVTGIDLAADLDAATIDKLSAALVEHKVLLFCDQHGLTPERQIAFGRNFGDLEVHPIVPHLDGHPEVMVLDLTGEQRTDDGSFHSDATFRAEPPMCSILRAVEVPDFGRDTLWVDMEAVFAGLSPTMQQLLGGLRARHDWAKQWPSAADHATDEDLLAARQRFQAMRAQLPIAEHPVVRTHPVSGRRALFVNPVFTLDVVGMRPDESAYLLEFLYAQSRIPEHQVRFRWEPGSVAMWDNRSVQHYVIFDRIYRRVMHRVTIAGDRPV
jgi:taurine dioxygenase